jgi:hypothetical protein
LRLCGEFFMPSLSIPFPARSTVRSWISFHCLTAIRFHTTPTF